MQQTNQPIKLLSPKDFENQMRLMNLPDAFKNTANFLLQFNLQNGSMLEQFQLGLTAALCKVENKEIVVTEETIEEMRGKAVDLKIDPEKNTLSFKLVEDLPVNEAQKIIS